MAEGAVHATIDSRDRESPSDHPGSYTVRLLDPVRDVVSVRVRSHSVPSPYSVPSGRGRVWVAPAGGAWEAADVAPGDYTEAGAAAALEAALASAAPGQTWSVSVGAPGVFSVASGAAFGIRGGDGQSRDGYGPLSAGRVFGFAAGEAASGPGNVLVAPHRHQLSRSEELYLRVEGFDAIGAPTSGPHGCTEVLLADGALHDTPAVRAFHPPLSRVERLRVRVVDYFGNPVDFDNREHRVDLVFSVGDAVRRVGGGF